jgi:hypothetical protein
MAGFQTGKRDYADGSSTYPFVVSVATGNFLVELKAFEALVRADEREACAQIAADYGPSRPILSKNPSSQIVGRWRGEQAASAAIDAAIRARGNI